MVGIIEREGLVQNAADAGRLPRGRACGRRVGRLPIVGELRGKGLLWGMELVTDRATSGRFDPALAVGTKVHKAGLKNGLVIYQSGGSAVASDEVFISPPLIVTRADIDEIVARLGADAGARSRTEVLPGRRSAPEAARPGGATP